MFSPDRWVCEPNWQPFAYDANGDRLTFVNVPREVQRQRTFLDRRFLQDLPKTDFVPVKSLPREVATDRAGPLHFIFHTAFCCSTLLTRAFDLPGAAMGLKEPEILLSFADAFESKGRSFEFHAALSITLDLLSRPLAPGETQIVKASNLANPIVPSILDARQDAKAIIMHSSLESYLRTTGKNELTGRSFNREALMQLRPSMPLHSDLTDAVIMRLTDLEVAALVWLMQVRFFKRVIAHHGAERVRTLSSQTLLARPAETLQSAGDFFNVAPKTTGWDEVAAGPVFKEHAKALGRPYNAEVRRTDLETAGAAHAREIAEVMQWARGLEHKLGGSITLGDTLFETIPRRPEPVLPRENGAPRMRPTPHHS